MAFNCKSQRVLFVVQQIARWSYFTLAVFSFIGAFVHLHVKIGSQSCKAIRQNYIDAGSNEKFDCIGDSLVWMTTNQFSSDLNVGTWRSLFTFTPENFIDKYVIC